MMLLFLGVVLAFVFWFFMFFPPLQPQINFWLTLTCSSGTLGCLGLIGTQAKLKEYYRWEKKHVVIGIVSAIGLYVIFWIGSIIIHALFPQSAAYIASVYVTRAHAPKMVIAMVLFFIIAPAEEIFWRGYVQRECARRWGQAIGYVFAVGMYTIVHLSSFNAVLLLGALTCGLLWGWLFLRFKSVWPGIISHAVWDILVFVILPFHR